MSPMAVIVTVPIAAGSGTAFVDISSSGTCSNFWTVVSVGLSSLLLFMFDDGPSLMGWEVGKL